VNTKRKIKYTFVFLSLALPIFLAVFFVFTRNGEAEVVSKGDVVINELMWAGSSLSTADEFIELKNISDNDINIEGWILSRVLDGKEVEMLVLPKGSKILAKKYFLISNYAQTYAKSIINIKSEVVDTAVSLSNDELQIKLYKGDMSLVGNLIDIAGNGKAPLVGENSDAKKSMERNLLPGDGQQKENWHTCANPENLKLDSVDFATPGMENSKPEEKVPDPPKVYSDKIIINEIFPAPLTGTGLEEFVELYSSNKEIENLDGWYLKDRAGKVCNRTGNIIDPAITKFLVLKSSLEKNCTLALNDTQGETLGLYNPTSSTPVFSVSYEGSAKKGDSYNFDGSRWRWSKFLTPGTENILNSEPYGTLKKAENIYVNIYANFLISTGDKDGDSIKATWDFGDGHKSYLAKTKHKYLATGKYLASVKLSDGSEDVLKEFTVEVKKIPHPKVSIVAVNANPKGKDSEFETVTVRNYSKKKINLKGWSIATGAKKLANHPIKESVVIKKGKTKEITRQVSSFSLNNKKAKIELRYPDGKVASKLKYDHGKVSIAEDEIYQKVKSSWVWIEKISNEKLQIPNNSQTAIDNSQELMNSEQEATEEMRKAVDGEWEVEKKGVRLPLWESNSQGDELVNIELLKNQPAVLGAETVREVGGQYFFTSQIEQKHYLISFWERILTKLNAGMNQLLNYF
jgi:hypothetical protein